MSFEQHTAEDLSEMRLMKIVGILRAEPNDLSEVFHLQSQIMRQPSETEMRVRWAEFLLNQKR